MTYRVTLYYKGECPACHQPADLTITKTIYEQLHPLVACANSEFVGPDDRSQRELTGAPPYKMVIEEITK